MKRQAIGVFFALFVCFPALAARKVYVPMGPATDPNWCGAWNVNVYCQVWNPSATTQTLTVDAYQTGAAGENVVNTTTSEISGYPTSYTLHTKESVLVSFACAVGGSVAATIPRAIELSVAEPSGYVSATCYFSTWAGNGLRLTEIAVNGGHAF